MVLGTSSLESGIMQRGPLMVDIAVPKPMFVGRKTQHIFYLVMHGSSCLYGDVLCHCEQDLIQIRSDLSGQQYKKDILDRVQS